MNRQDILSDLKKNPEVSVLIVGGGINGVGVFRDLALNGVDVLLVERGDFCSGASAASSHMAHGGIRYLENGEFRLVREAVQERNRLIQNAPHIVKPLPTTIPIFKYLSGIFNASLRKWPRLNPKIVNTATYYDGSIQNPERLALEMVLDAELENPKARALNYVGLVSGQKDTVVLRDELTGRTIEIKPKLLVNAAGPWIDF